MKLNSRTKAIIEHLLKSEKYITYDELGKKIDVSSRTIAREMKEVEDWFKENDIDLIRKQRKGLIVDVVAPVKLKLLESLSSSSVYKIYTQKERLDFIMLELVQDEHPIKQFYFSSLLNVSEATISHDLDKVGPILLDYNLELVRKPGVGIFILGPEVQKRQLLTSILYQYYDKEQLFNMTRNEIVEPSSKQQIVSESKDRLLGLVDKESLIKLEQIVDDISSEFNYPLTDISKVGLIVHLAIYIERIKKNERITIDHDILDLMKNSEEFNLASKISERVSKTFNVEVPDSENGYITMHLKGARVETFTHNKEYIFSNFELVRMTNKMISEASQISGIDLTKDQQLFIGLITHLKPVLIRLKLNLTIRNPMLDEIKTNYLSYFQMAKSCQLSIEKELEQEIPEEETAFLAMHLGSAIERLRGLRKRKIRVVVTCTTGIGSSRMLTARLSQEFKDFDIVETLASPSIDVEQLKEQGIDLVISTIAGYKFELPTIVVTPLLSSKDINYIREYISKMDIKLTEKEVFKTKEVTKRVLDPRGKISETNLLSASALKLLECLDFYDFKPKTVSELIRSYSETFDQSLAKIVRKSLEKREKMGSTIIRKNNILLLHSKVKGLSDLKASFISIDKIEYKGATIESVIVLLVDHDSPSHELRLISQISRNLITNEKFIDAVTNNNTDDIELNLSQIMFQFIKNEMIDEVSYE